MPRGQEGQSCSRKRKGEIRDKARMQPSALLGKRQQRHHRLRRLSRQLIDLTLARPSPRWRVQSLLGHGLAPGVVHDADMQAVFMIAFHRGDWMDRPLEQSKAPTAQRRKAGGRTRLRMAMEWIVRIASLAWSSGLDRGISQA